MKKIIISLFITVLLLGTTYGLNDGRTCETKYSVIGGMKYFSGIHCTENIKLTGVVADNPPLRDVSDRKVNDFIAANNYKFVEYMEGSGSCDSLNTLSEVQGFENIIYSNNDISYTTTTASIETLTTEIEDLKENYNEEGLYNTIFDEAKAKFPLGSIDFLRVETRESYFEKQADIKEQVLSKQKEKLTLLYKITESQKFIESFYNKLDRLCNSYDIKKTDDNSTEEDSDEDKEALIQKYKEEFNVKLGAKLDILPRQTLEQLSIKLLSYADTSTIFKRFSEKQRELVKLKITALKAAIDDRLN